MINPNAGLVHNLYSPDIPQAATRDGYGVGILEVAERDERIMVVCADLAESTRNEKFKEVHPKRYVEVGVAEQNLAALASGLAAAGKIPYIASYAAFSPGRNNEQIRTTISLNNQPVKVVGFHAGLSVGPDGATHQALEDIALMRTQPNMTVIVPADLEEARKAVHLAYEHNGPVYIRLARDKSPVFTEASAPMSFGKANVLITHEVPVVTLIATGPLVYQALLAAKVLEEEGLLVTVINLHTIKPFDEDTVVEWAKRSGAVVSIEEHQIAAGLGGAVAEVLSRRAPTIQEYIGVHDRYGQSGTTPELYNEYGLDTAAIVAAAKRAIERKTS